MRNDHDQRAQTALLATLLAFFYCACAHTVQARRDNGKISAVGEHVRGLRKGPWTDYYASRQKLDEGYYEDDLRTGLWTYWFENGNKEMEGRFADELQDGDWEYWHESGALRARGRFEQGFEEGLWQFHERSGALEREGTYELGKPVLRWTVFHPDTAVRESGNYHAGVRVGAWTTQDAAGNKTESSYPFPAGLELVEEHFTDSTIKRTGFLRDGVPAGRWNSYHPGGKLRMECCFSKGKPNGRACAWREDGKLLASGSLEDGCVTGEWVFYRGSTEDKRVFKETRPHQAFSGDWSPASSAENPGCTVVETWLAELCSPRQPAPIPAVPSPVTPVPLPTPVSDNPPDIPVPPQLLTEYEIKALRELAKLYGSGIPDRHDEEDWTSVPQRMNPTPKTGVATPADLKGRKLRLKHFKTADGGKINLDDYAGKKNVLVTILKGFGGQVCVYCEAQTKGLEDYADEFAALDTEVVIVYPGPENGMKAFLEAYQDDLGAGEKPTHKLLYDSELTLTRELRIKHSMAVPTSILLDRNGIIQWSHVAKDDRERPSAEDVLKEIAALPKDNR